MASTLESILKGGLSQQVFANKIEKHIDDLKAGVGNLSREVDYELSARDSSVSLHLSQTNPNALRLYSSYSSLFTYDQYGRQARFISSVEYNTRLDIPDKSEEELQKDAEALIAQYVPPEGSEPPAEPTEPADASVGFKTIQDVILESASALATGG